MAEEPITLEDEVLNRSMVDAGTTTAVRAVAEDVAEGASDAPHLLRWRALRRTVSMGHTVFLLPLPLEGGLDRSPP